MAIQDKTLKTTPTQELITRALKDSMAYSEFTEHVGKLVAQKQSSGDSQNEEYVHYTLLNYQRMRRWDKKTSLGDSELSTLKNLEEPRIWLVLTESWCGDAAPVLPILQAFAQATPMLELRIALRDMNPELMDRFLTDNARSIPKLLVLNPENEMEVEATWGPRPQAARELVLDYKERFGKLDAEFRETLQKWYNQDKGNEIRKEVLGLLTLE